MTYQFFHRCPPPSPRLQQLKTAPPLETFLTHEHTWAMEGGGSPLKVDLYSITYKPLFSVSPPTKLSSGPQVSPNFAVKTHLNHTLAVALCDAGSVSQVSHLNITT